MKRSCEPCPIWGTPAIVEPYDFNDKAHVDSPRAGGKYDLYNSGRSCIDCDDREKVRLTSWLVEQRSMGIEEPVVDRCSVEKAIERKDLAAGERVDLVLEFLAKETRIMGEEISCHIHRANVMFPNSTLFSISLEELPPDYLRNVKAQVSSESTNADELNYLLNYANGKGWIESGKNEDSYIVTVDGYARLSELEKRNVDSSRAFVAMWFDSSLDDAWERGIEPGIGDAGYEAIRIDNKEHINRIDDEIIAELRRSRFVVADFTQGDDGARGGVYYEAGFAHGLNIPVIFTCRADAIGEVHFDTRNYNHIVWEGPEDLRQKLAKRIAAVIGDGPMKTADDNG